MHGLVASRILVEDYSKTGAYEFLDQAFGRVRRRRQVGPCFPNSAVHRQGPKVIRQAQVVGGPAEENHHEIRKDYIEIEVTKHGHPAAGRRSVQFGYSLFHRGGLVSGIYLTRVDAMTPEKGHVLHPGEVVLIGHKPIRYDVAMLEGHVVDFVLRVDADLPVGFFIELAALSERYLVEVAAVDPLGHAAEIGDQVLARIGIQVDENESVPDLRGNRAQAEFALVQIVKVAFVWHPLELPLRCRIPSCESCRSGSHGRCLWHSRPACYRDGSRRCKRRGPFCPGRASPELKRCKLQGRGRSSRPAPGSPRPRRR